MGGSEDDPCTPIGFRCFVHICIEYENATNDPELFGTREEVFGQFGISEQDACGFAVYGLETQDQLTFESDLNRLAEYTLGWRGLALSYETQLQDQFRIRIEAKEKLEQRLTEPPM